MIVVRAAALPVRNADPMAFAWRRGLVMSDRAPLSEEAETLDLMAHGPALVVNDRLLGLTLSGTFRAVHPAAVPEDLNSALGIRSPVVPGMVTLIHRWGPVPRKKPLRRRRWHQINAHDCRRKETQL